MAMIAFDDRTIERGVRYYRSGRVLYTRVERDTVVALVAGSRDSPYTVFLSIDDPAKSQCTCPVGVECKHMVAVLAAIRGGELKNTNVAARVARSANLTAIDDALDRVDSSEFEPPKPRVAGRRPHMPPERNDPVGDYLIELQQTVGDARPRRVVETPDRGVRIVYDESATRWRVAFVVWVDHLRRLLVSSVRQYRRNDEEYGRLDQLAPGEPVFLSDARAAPLVQRLDALGGTAPLVAFVDAILDLGVPMFEARSDRLSGSQNHPLTFARPERVDLEVEPLIPPRNRYGSTIGRPGSEIALALTVYAQSEGNRRVIDSGRCAVGTGMGRSVMLVEGTGTVVVADARMPLAPLAQFLTHDGRVSPEEIAAIGRICASAPDLLQIRFPPRIRVVTVDPEPCFVLSDGVDSIVITLLPGTLPEDGYVGDEFRIHRATTTGSPAALRLGDEIAQSDATRLDDQNGWLWEAPHDDADLCTIAFRLIAAGFTVYLEDPTRGRRRVQRAPHVSVRISSGTDWFSPIVRNADGAEIDWHQLERMAYGGTYGDGDQVVLLDPSDVDRIRRLLDLVAGTSNRRTPHADIATLVEMAEIADSVDPDVEAIRSFAHEILSGSAQTHAAPPEGLAATLRPYQIDGYAWLRMLARHGLSGCLADDMGLGKTVQALALMLHLHEEARRTAAAPTAKGPAARRRRRSGESAEPAATAGGFLVVAPVSTLTNWAREASRFAPALSTRVHHGPDRSADSARLTEVDLVVTSYATAARDVTLLETIEWRLLVLDEAQFIKNPHATTAKRLKGLRSRLRLCLTGTPVENVTTDLWSIMDFLVPGLLGSLSSFTHRFPKRNVANSETDQTRIERLRRIVSPFLMRRTKEAVAPELPPRIETLLTCEMGPKQARFYETMRAYHYAKVEDAIESGEQSEIGPAILTGLLRLRQAAIYPADADPTGEGVPSAKEEDLLDQLDEVAAEGHRAIVFSQFVSALKKLRDAASTRGIDTLYLDGRTRNRPALIDRFQRSTSPIVFFISLKAGGTGINLTAADHVFICDPWWNPQVERQAVDRAHRIGRDRPVIVTRLVTAGTVEEKVVTLQDQKRRLAADLIAENVGGIDASNAQEILALFERDA
ncbi:MAG: hypothetical protein EA382_00795 [Spirochaetaceae bacterium]|nr:MAG: hypothetical protein EA382_00795 [Spirochaetaceae bacterium]